MDKVKKVNEITLLDCQVKQNKIAETVGMLNNSMVHIVHEFLGMRKPSGLMGAAFAYFGQQDNQKSTL